LRLHRLAALACAPAALLFAHGVARAAQAAATDCAIEKFAELPVTMVDGQPIVAVKINGQDGRFVISSGFYTSQISTAAARKWNLHWESTYAPVGVRTIAGDGDRRPPVVSVKSFTLANANLGRADFILTDGVAQSEGTLGQNVLSMADVEYDLPHNTVRLMKAPRCTDINFAYWHGDQSYSVLDIEPHDAAHPYIAGAVLLNGIKLRAVFDSGYPATLISLQAAAKAGIRPGDPGVTPLADEGHMKRWVAPVASISIGDEGLAKTHVVIADLHRADIDMVIGADFFLSHRIYVANTSHQMFFTYAGGKPFDVSGRIVAHATPPLAPTPSQIRDLPGRAYPPPMIGNF
jgi:predicted aspartyl protease